VSERSRLKHAKDEALNHKSGNEWINISAAEFVDRVRHVALGLADMASSLATASRCFQKTVLSVHSRSRHSQPGAINVPIYTTRQSNQIATSQ